MYWMKNGAPPAMLVMGSTATTTSFTLRDATSHGVGAPVKMNGSAIVKGTPGRYRKMEGHLSYYEVLQID